MLGREHGLSGIAGGAAVGELVLHLPPSGVAVLVGLTGAMACLPDLDQCESSAARCLGWLSASVAWVVEHLSGGHRHATHSIMGIAVFTGWAWAGYHWHRDPGGKAALALLMAVALAAGLRALHLGGHLADTAALAGGIAIGVSGRGMHEVVLATALGCAIHVVGDMLTTEGCPLLWPVTMYHFRLLPRSLAFDAGAWQEVYVILPALLGTTGWLGAADMPMHHALTSRAHAALAAALALALGLLVTGPGLLHRRRRRRWGPPEAGTRRPSPRRT
jgi:membrane-bound metal-dependent hydrolase YbcI (DUF457 family)